MTDSLGLLLQLISYDSLVARQGLTEIILLQLVKGALLIAVEFVCQFYSQASGISAMKWQFYVLIEVILALDILCAFNWKDHLRVNKQVLSQRMLPRLLSEAVTGVLLGAVTALCSIYAFETPATESGTIQPSTFTEYGICLGIFHALIFRKIFLNLTTSYSVLKLLVLVAQIVLFYLGLAIFHFLDT